MNLPVKKDRINNLINVWCNIKIQTKFYPRFSGISRHYISFCETEKNLQTTIYIMLFVSKIPIQIAIHILEWKNFCVLNVITFDISTLIVSMCIYQIRDIVLVNKPIYCDFCSHNSYIEGLNVLLGNCKFPQYSGFSTYLTNSSISNAHTL